MDRKGKYKHSSIATKLSIFSIILFVSALFHILVALIIGYWIFPDVFSFFQNPDLTNPDYIFFLKIQQLFLGIGLFVSPLFLFSYFTDFSFHFVKLSRQSILLVLAIMLFITPFVGWLMQWNMQIPLPEALLQLDKSTEQMSFALLKINNLWDLLFTLLVIAAVPAIGEELFFRGFIQQLLGRWWKNPHLAIFIAAFVFSAIHIHFQGFIPRLFLGVLLGYLYYWSGSIWLPIIAHFINNAQAVLLSYYHQNNDANYFLAEETVSLKLAFISFFAVMLLLFLLHAHLQKQKRDCN